MTPKEKAEELVDKFINLNSHKMSDYSRIEYPTAKQCALIAVDEILNNFLSNRTTKYGRERYDFWQKVKQEIKLL